MKLDQFWTKWKRRGLSHSGRMDQAAPDGCGSHQLRLHRRQLHSRSLHQNNLHASSVVHGPELTYFREEVEWEEWPVPTWCPLIQIGLSRLHNKLGEESQRNKPRWKQSQALPVTRGGSEKGSKGSPCFPPYKELLPDLTEFISRKDILQDKVI